MANGAVEQDLRSASEASRKDLERVERSPSGRSGWQPGPHLRTLLYSICFPLIVLGLLVEKLLEHYKTHPEGVHRPAAETGTPWIWIYEGVLLTIFVGILFLTARSAHKTKKKDE